MKNYIQPGKSIDVPAPAGGVVSGKVYIIGALIGVSSVTAAEGTMIALQTEEVFDLEKTSAQAWAIGDKIYLDAATKVATKTVGSNTLIGVAVAVAANPSPSGWVKLGALTV